VQPALAIEKAKAEHRETILEVVRPDGMHRVA